jgi:RHH-type proline utilization regulon transcriptional repressor/proline dehydrogenase/delta 1-pyrroline-5-carboxylate dehydrogenase
MLPVRAAVSDQQIADVGRRLAGRMSQRRGFRRTVDDRLMTWVAADPHLRAALFRFVDVRPACRNVHELSAHLAGLLAEVEQPSTLVALSERLARIPLSRAPVAAVAALTVRGMAHRFIVGEDEARALPFLEGLWRRGVAASIDLLGEATVAESEADRYERRCHRALLALAARSRAWPAHPLLERDAAGQLPRVNLSVKLSALTPHLRAEAPDRGIVGARDRLRRLMRRARELEAHLHVDMESLDHRAAVLRSVLDLLGEPEFRDGPSAGIVHQAYLRDSADQLTEILEWVAASGRPVPLTIRLVKGAYWDHELVEARQHGWAVPVYEDRAACDRNFEALTRQLVDHIPAVRLAIASHNLRSVAHAVAYQGQRGLPPGDVEYQVLRGLGDDLQDALAAEGLRVRVYCPIGDLVAGMAYLVRRLLENTSNDSFLRARAEGQDLNQLLRSP